LFSFYQFYFQLIGMWISRTSGSIETWISYFPKYCSISNKRKRSRNVHSS